jgi:hypothetical protein
MKRINWPTVLISVVASLVITGGVATAGSLITSKQIKNGAITEAKLSKKVKLKLNNVGANGRDGANGIAGASGVNGSNGLDGVNGQNGAKGDRGATGDTGAQGIQGAKGATGDTGAQGIQGAKGATGDTGAQGIQGETGETGAKGSTGDTGAQGIQGETGATGQTGGTGPTGPKGDQGEPPAPSTTVLDDSLLGWLLADYGDNSTCNATGSDPCVPNGELALDASPVPGSLGDNALRFQYDLFQGKRMAAYIPFSDQRLSRLTALSYETLVSSTGLTGSDDITMSIEVRGAASGNPAKWGGNLYGTIVYEPAYNTAPDGTWNSHNVMNGTVWFTQTPNATDECGSGDPCTFARFLELNPDARIQTVKLATGQNSGAGWAGFDGYADAVTIGFGANAPTTYDLGG